MPELGGPSREALGPIVLFVSGSLVGGLVGQLVCSGG